MARNIAVLQADLAVVETALPTDLATLTEVCTLLLLS